MTRYDVEDLRRYEAASYAAAAAECHMRENARRDPATVDRLHQAARHAVIEFHAASIAVGLDPLMPHPTREREVWDAIEAAGLSRVIKSNQRQTKNAIPNC